MSSEEQAGAGPPPSWWPICPPISTARASAIDYDALAARFSRPQELRRIEDPRQPVFAFLFVRVRDDELDQLDETLRADLTKSIRVT